MSDLIDRQTAIDALEERLQANGYSNVALVSELNRSIGYLKQLPSAQPEQKRGSWEYVKKRLARGGYVDASECSVCHKMIMPHLKPNFCPNCGAEMKGEEE